MKELSIEEKAIAYDEVIERANSLLSGNELGNDWIYKLLPELRESEDERIRKALISILKSDFEKDTTIYDISIGNIIAWLEKQGEQKPAEWSDKDENIRQWITSDIDKLLALKKKSHIIADKEINWLKSLKERYSWKPSDEQMEALLYEVNAWDKDSVNGQNLKSLYQELKKLKEK